MQCLCLLQKYQRTTQTNQCQRVCQPASEAGGGAEEPRITRQQPISSRENRQEGVESSSSLALHLGIGVGKPAEAGALKLGCQKLESAGSARRQER